MIDNNPSTSIRSIASDMGVSEFLVRQLVHEDFQYFSYRMVKEQLISQVMKDKTKDRAAKRFSKLNYPLKTNMLCFFSDKKIFCLDQMVNPENNSWFIPSPHDAPIETWKSNTKSTSLYFGGH